MAKFELTTYGKKKASGGLLVNLDGNGDWVNLAGKDLTVKVKEAPSRPAHTVAIRAAKQEDLAKFFNLGTQKLVKKIETKAEIKEAAKAETK